LKKNKIIKIILLILFIIYFIVLTKLILFKYGYNFLKAAMMEWNISLVRQHTQSANIIPFSTIVWSIRMGGWKITLLFYNIIAFVPFGIFCKLYSYKSTLLKSLIIGVLVSLLFEVIQLVTLLGEFDIDDIILNTLGVFIGYLVSVATGNIYKRLRKDEVEK